MNSGTIESFAALCARLDDPFAERRAVLSEAGLDERAWIALEAHWLNRIREEDELTPRFVEAYVKARSGGMAVEAPCTPAPQGQRFLSAEEQPWRAEAAAVPLSADDEVPPMLCPVDTDPEVRRPIFTSAPPPANDDGHGTLEVPVLRPAAVLPFAPHVAILAPLVEPPRTTLRPPPHDDDHGTMELSAYCAERPALPFPGEAPPPGKRLARFDPLTGAPLPAPMWIDVMPLPLAPDPERTACPSTSPCPSLNPPMPRPRSPRAPRCSATSSARP